MSKKASIFKSETHLIIHNLYIKELANLWLFREHIARFAPAALLYLRKDIDEFPEHIELRPVDLIIVTRLEIRIINVCSAKIGRMYLSVAIVNK